MNVQVFLLVENYTDKKKMVSPHLQGERDRLLREVEHIRQLGHVAPASVWIGPNFQVKGEKLYEYYKLNSENPQVKHQHLGKAGSEKYRDWADRIRRRDAISELEVQLSMLQRLIERQAGP